MIRFIIEIEELPNGVLTCMAAPDASNSPTPGERALASVVDIAIKASFDVATHGAHHAEMIEGDPGSTPLENAIKAMTDRAKARPPLP